LLIHYLTLIQHVSTCDDKILMILSQRLAIKIRSLRSMVLAYRSDGITYERPKMYADLTPF
jgi:hypothetical protein